MNNPELTAAVSGPTGWGKWTILFFVALVAAPIVYKMAPSEIAKWYLAAAHNSYRLQDIEATQTHLGTAVGYSESIRTNPDYVQLQVQLIAEISDGDQAMEYYRDTVSKDPSSSIAIGYIVSQSFCAAADFERALEALALVLPEDRQELMRRLEQRPSAAEVLNFRAYLRSLANTEIEEAIADIELAVRDRPGEPSLLDTKAWVLYRAKRFPEAAETIEESLELFGKAIEASGRYFGEEPPEDASASAATTPEGAGKTESVSSKTDERIVALREALALIDRQVNHKTRYQLLETRLGLLRTYAVLRYHRAKIYDAMNEPSKSAKDWRWLMHNGFQDESMLY